MKTVRANDFIQQEIKFILKASFSIVSGIRHKGGGADLPPVNL